MTRGRGARERSAGGKCGRADQPPGDNSRERHHGSLQRPPTRRSTAAAERRAATTRVPGAARASVADPDGPLTEPARRRPPRGAGVLARLRRYQVVAQLGPAAWARCTAPGTAAAALGGAEFLHHTDRCAGALRARRSLGPCRPPRRLPRLRSGRGRGRPYSPCRRSSAPPRPRRARAAARRARAAGGAGRRRGARAHRIGLIHRDLNRATSWSPGARTVAPLRRRLRLARDQRITGLSVSGPLSARPATWRPSGGRRGSGARPPRRRLQPRRRAVRADRRRLPLPAANFAEAIVKLLQQDAVPRAR